MPTDLLSLALAAAMPLAAFALYAGFRAFGDRRAHRPSRSRRARNVRATASSIDQARAGANPINMARPMDPPLPERSVQPQPTPGPVAPHSAAPAEPARPMLAKLQAQGPGPARRDPERREPVRRMLAKLSVSRPAEAASGNGHSPIASASTDRVDHAVAERSAGKVEAMPRIESHPAPDRAAGHQLSPAPARVGPVGSRADAGPDGPAPRGAGGALGPTTRRRGPGLLSSSLKPILGALGRGRKRSSALPAWPEPERLGEPFPLITTSDGSGPCPFCAESAERGAWFCRRCRRPVDARAAAATSAVNFTAVPLPIPIQTTQSMPAIPRPSTPPATQSAGADSRPLIAGVPATRPARSTAGPLITSLPVIHPTQYVPAARSTGGRPVQAERSEPLAPSPGANAARAGTARRPASSPARPSAEAATPGSRSATSGPRVVRPAAVVARAPGSEPNGVHVGTSRDPLVAVGPGRPTSSDRVDLNRATAAQLSGLHGVGRVTARKIIEAREEQAIATVDSLVDRRIVARSVVEKLRDQVTV